jgi:hypothetical protein
VAALQMWQAGSGLLVKRECGGCRLKEGGQLGKAGSERPAVMHVAVNSMQTKTKTNRKVLTGGLEFLAKVKICLRLYVQLSNN